MEETTIAMPSLSRRTVAGALLLIGPGLRAAAAAAAKPTAERFRAFIEGLRPDAIQQSITGETFDTVFAGLTPDPSLAPLTERQPEFAKPTGAYLAAQVTPARIAQARRQLARWQDVLAATESRSGVPAAIVVAVWALESNFGSAMGSKDVIRSLATLAALGFRPELMRTELLAALALLQNRDVTRDQLRGSWAGAMGQPQFMPSSFARYAVDGDGDGRRDIWTSVPDSLASIANFLAKQGYRAGDPWGFEVRLPRGFDLRTSRGSFAEWAARGFTRPDGRPLPERGDGILFFPAGAAGPAFLVTANFEVLKTYNFSDAYVLSVGTLADRMEGGAPIAARWPDTVGMSRSERIALQARMAALGYPVDNREGRISLALRDSIRKAQESVHLTPDGNPTVALLHALAP